MLKINKKIHPLINHGDINKAFWKLKALSHPLQIQIIKLLDSQGEMIVTELRKKLEKPQSQISQCLAMMRKEGVVHTERDGKNIYYSLDYDRIEKINETIKTFSGN